MSQLACAGQAARVDQDNHWFMQGRQALAGATRALRRRSQRRAFPRGPPWLSQPGACGLCPRSRMLSAGGLGAKAALLVGRLGRDTAGSGHTRGTGKLLAGAGGLGSRAARPHRAPLHLRAGRVLQGEIVCRGGRGEEVRRRGQGSRGAEPQCRRPGARLCRRTHKGLAQPPPRVAPPPARSARLPG